MPLSSEENRQRPQKRKKIISPVSKSESDDEMSVQIISGPKKKVFKKQRKRSSDNTHELTEEKKYQKKLKYLKVHGGLTGEE
jgi:hypothetical protein